MKENNPHILGTEKVGKLLLEYSIPAIIGMTLTSLYNIIDSVFIGHGVGAMAISGLAISFPLMNLLVAFCTLVGVGGATISSIRLGQKDTDGAEKVLGNVTVLCVINSIFYGGITLLFLDRILFFFTELAAIEAASACQTQEGGFRQLLNPAMYKVLTIGVVMAILQQWCGINVIFNYAQEIFMAAGYGVSDVLMNIVVTGITNVIFTILAMFVVDRWGRKALTLIGSFGLAVIYAFMGAAYYFHITGVVLLIIVVMAIACYAMTLATVMWVIISEIFPNRIRGVAMSVCTFALWAACFILTYTFPMLNSGLGAAGTFWLYGLICLSGGIFVVFRLPETKGKSLEEIEKELVK